MYNQLDKSREDFIASYFFDYINDERLISLPFPVILRIINHPNLAIKTLPKKDFLLKCSNKYIDEQYYNEAKKLYDLAVQQINSYAINNFGYLYYYNGQEIKQDYNKAKYYYELSAQQKNSYSINNLGNLYYNENSKASLHKSCEMKELKYLKIEMPRRIKITHRDLYSGNILNDSQFNSKITDFAYSRFLPDNVCTMSSRPIPTSKFRAPKLTSDDKYHPEVDAFIFSKIFYKLLTGKMPFEWQPFLKIDKMMVDKECFIIPDNISSGLRDLIKNCWDPDPAELPSISEIVDTMRANMRNSNKIPYIDTDGFADADGCRTKMLNSLMMSHLKKLNLKLAICFDSQKVCFSDKIKQKICFYHDFFKHPKIWEHACIIFTNCNPNKADDKYLQTKFRRSVANFIQSLSGCEQINPQLPCFFINTDNMEKSEETKNENNGVLEKQVVNVHEDILIFDFAMKNQQISTEYYSHIRYDDSKNENEKLKNLFVKNDTVINTNKCKFKKENKNLKFENEFKTENNKLFKRIVFTDPDGNMTYGKWHQA